MFDKIHAYEASEDNLDFCKSNLRARDIDNVEFFHEAVHSKDGETLVGQSAKRQAVTNPKNTIYSAKRFIGRSFSEVASENKKFPYEISKGMNIKEVYYCGICRHNSNSRSKNGCTNLWSY